MIAPLFSVCASSPAVRALIGDSPVRLYPFGQQDDNVIYPYVVWQNVSGAPENYLGQHPDADTWALQVDAWADTPDEVIAVATALRDAIEEYGNAIRQLAAANIFPGDMLFKNFGVTRHGRVVFYDYDEICYMTEVNFRDIPQPRYPEDELSGEPWYSVSPGDVFPEEFRHWLCADPRIGPLFEEMHEDLFRASYWRGLQTRIKNGHIRQFDAVGCSNRADFCFITQQDRVADPVIKYDLRSFQDLDVICFSKYNAFWIAARFVTHHPHHMIIKTKTVVQCMLIRIPVRDRMLGNATFHGGPGNSRRYS